MPTNFTQKAIQSLALGAFFALGALSVAATYAAWNLLVPVSPATGSTQLSSSEWNKIVSNLETIDSQLGTSAVPSWAVMAFNRATCPVWWSSADGNGGRPDLRGEFIRGLDGGRGVDSGRTLGSSQKASRMMGHYANNFSEFISTSDMECLQSGVGNNLCPSNADWKRNLEDLQSWNGSTTAATSWTSISSTSIMMSAAIRPRNVALLYCVKN